jgi:nicotinamidase-related amidase
MSEPVGDPIASNHDGGAGGSAGAGGGSAGAGTGGGTGGGAGTGGPETKEAVGIVVVDVQETFVNIAANDDIAGIIERAKTTFKLAEDHKIPFFITFEASQTGDHSLHAPLSPVLPGHAKDFTKTTFDATGLLSFSEAIKQSGLSHLVVLGAETDVCVLQTVLGLRAMGFTVMLQKDAVFTSETNTSPALRRMQQAGTLLVDVTEVEGYVAKQSELPKGGDHPVTLVKPLQMGVVLNNFTDASLAGSADPLMSQKSARLRELLLVSEWFELPVYVSDVAAGLPDAFAPYYKGELRPISEMGKDIFVKQLVLAGTDGGLTDVMSYWIKSRALFVMEDALLALGTPAAQKEMLDPFFQEGLVPMTYKTFYYDMTKSVSLSEWPSQQWVKKHDEYYWITEAPEDLPPIDGD